MSTIQQTIGSALASQGRRLNTIDGAIVDALEEREERITDRLVAKSIKQGLDKEEIGNLLVDVGLAEPPPRPELTTDDRLERIEVLLQRVINQLTMRF